MALGKIRYGEACPALKELLERKGILDRTRDVATAALIACGGKEAVDKPISSQLYELAEKYYYQRESVAPDPNYATASVWYWKEGIGLEYKAVPREIFGDIYAMRLARKALKYDSAFYPAVSLWLAAKIKKEIDLPAGTTDPTTVPGEPSAQFYALAGSAKYMQDVLNRALEDGNPALALQAIEALSKTAGAQSLVEPVAGGVQPLVAAMGNHDREVRMLAALTLAGALPQKHFDGDDMVMFIINEALRLVGKKQALLVAADQSQRNMLKDALRTAKYEVIEQADADKAIAAAREVNGLDMIVLGELPSVTSTVERLRSDPVCAAAPIVIASSDERAQRLAKAEGHIVLISDKAKSSEAAEAIAQAEKMGQAGALPAEKSAEWAIRAADAIAMLGTTANPVFDISKALGGLCEALGDPRGEVRMAAARALASMPSPQAQAALADMAINPSEFAVNISLDEKSRIDFFKVLVESLRRFGNKLTEKQAQAVVQIVTNDKETMPLRLAAAEVMGAMNLPSDKIKSLIVDSPMAE